MFFALTWNFWGDCTRNTSKQRKMATFSEEFLSDNGFETFLATYCCYDYSVNVSEAVEKITANEKDYQKCLWCVIVR